MPSPRRTHIPYSAATGRGIGTRTLSSGNTQSLPAPGSSVLVSCPADPDMRQAFDEILESSVKLIYWTDLDESARKSALAESPILLGWNPPQELGGEQRLADMPNLKLMQLLTSGADHISYGTLRESITVASNPGAFAEPMAEHILAMTLTLAKDLRESHHQLVRGHFEQFSPTRSLAGGACVIVGFGGVGQASARLFKALGMHIIAINRRGLAGPPADRAGTLSDLPTVLPLADVVILALPLTCHTRGIFDAELLGRLRDDAILINAARGELIDESALYHHLRDHPQCRAGIDAWWVEPFRHGRFELRHPLLELPNLLGSPHNSSVVPGAETTAARMAAINCRRYLNGSGLRGVVDPRDYDLR